MFSPCSNSSILYDTSYYKYLEIPQLGEGIDYNTEDYVQTNGGEENEEGYLVED